MNRVLFCIVAVALISRSVSAKEPAPASGSPEALVAQLYKAHSGESDPLQYPASKQLLPQYFYKPLLDLYLKDQKESKGEIGKIDFDPLYDAQDFRITNFTLVFP
jgi:hypothetical protein